MHLPRTALRRLFWWPAVSGADANGDLWFWEDQDEEFVNAFADPPYHALRMPLADWTIACLALKTRQLECRRTTSPLSHLTPQSRFYFMAWFIIAEVARKGKLETGDNGGLHDLIACWGMSLGIVGSDRERCRICRVSHILAIWLETMLEVYMLDDLRLIPWYPECSCFNK
jgi:hypothetical protein